MQLPEKYKALGFERTARAYDGALSRLDVLRDAAMNGGGFVFWSLVNNQGDEITHVHGGTCNGSMDYAHSFGSSPAKGVLNKRGCAYYLDFSSVYRARKPEFKDVPLSEAERAYVSWLTNESAWQFAYLIKDPDELVFRGGMYNTDYPAKYCVQAMMLIRSLAIHKGIVEAWYDLAPHCDPHWALMMAHSFARSKLVVNNMVKTSAQRGHQAVDPAYSGAAKVRSMIKVAAGEEPGPDFWIRQPMFMSSSYEGMMSIWSGPNTSHSSIDHAWKAMKARRSSTKNTLGMKMELQGWQTPKALAKEALEAAGA